MTKQHRAGLLLLLCAAILALPAAAQKITTPKEQFGFNLGDDYQLATYTQLTEYWKKLDQESDRMALVDIGKTAEGRPQWMAVITAPENHKKLPRYKEIARRLAHAEGLTDEQARALAAEGRAVVWIDGGLHATEVLGAQQLMETVYQMVSRSDPETLRFLRDVILLAVHANPDGHELVAASYMRDPEPAKRRMNIPRLYQKYVGHDNNRDFYLSSQAESTNMNRQLYIEWFPQIMYNHHQTGPAGTVLFAPPFRDPFNYNFDPLIPIGLNLVGAAMHGRFAAEGKPGATMLEGASYSTWFNGGLRTTTYFHNMIGLLTETIGTPAPMEIPFLPNRQLPSKDLPYPIAPQKWHFRQSVEYSLTANRAVLDIASKHREDFLFNIYQMGRNSIERGSRDHWTMTPTRIAKVQEEITRARALPAEERTIDDRGMTRFRGAPMKYYDQLRDPSLRDPRGYILPSDQPDFLTATKFIHSLLKTGVTVHRATAAFTVAGKNYPAGSYVVKSAQAFRPHVLDMFEPQDHPNDVPYPGGPPKAPYDITGYTLAWQMGVQFDRLLEAFDGPFEKIAGMPPPPAGKVTEASAPAGYLVSHQANDSFVAVNRLLKGGHEVYWLKDAAQAGGVSMGPGAIYIPAKGAVRPLLAKLAAEVGLNFHGVAAAPKGEALQLRPVRIGLWDRFGGSMPSGWVRWLFEQFEFPFEVVYPAKLNAGDLRSQFDVLVFMGGAIPARDGSPAGRGEGGFGPPANRDTVPAEFHHMLGNIAADTMPHLRKFLESGGTVLAVGSSASLAAHLGLPVSSVLVERAADGREQAIPREKFYIPGSVLQVRVDPAHPLAWGMSERADVMFQNSPVFRVRPDGVAGGVRPIAWFDSAKPLRSGWANGQHYLEGGVAVIEAPVGEGKLFLYGPEVTFRGQPHGTFKLFFNGIYYGSARRAQL